MGSPAMSRPLQAVIVLCIMSVILFSVNHLQSPHVPRLSGMWHSPSDADRSSFASAISTVFPTSLHSFTAPYRHPDGTVYEIASPIWQEPLGKKLCIVDIDTRPMDGVNEVWSENGTLNWENAGRLTPGIMNHYLYAQIHGYDYQYIHTTDYPGRWSPWTKPPALAELIKNYRFVVSVDADILFPHLLLPYEWLLNRWDITEDIIVAMALDIDWTDAVDKQGRQRVNAGFVTLQNTPLTHQLLYDWSECPESGSKFEGCENYKNVWPAEQGAFNEYIRYEYPKNVREIPCDEGTGSPNSPLACRGQLVQHYTLNKEDVRPGMETALAAAFMPNLQNHMIEQKEQMHSERLDNVFNRR